MMGDRIALLRPGGRLAQYDTPDGILAAPADDFVASFVGADRGLKRLALTRLDELELGPLDGVVAPERPGQDDVARRALVDADRGDSRRRRARRRRAAARHGDARRAVGTPGRLMTPLAQSGSRDPRLRRGQRLHPAEPRLLPGVGDRPLGRHPAAGAARPHQADRDRRRAGLRDRVRRSAPRVPPPEARGAGGRLLGVPLHDPEPRAVPAARSGHGADGDDGRGGARLLHAADPLPKHRRGAPRRAARRDRGCARDGDESRPDPRRVELPLALPAIAAGLRIATVSTIALATVAASSSRKGSATRSSWRCASSSRRS